MIKNIIVLHRDDLPQDERALPIQAVPAAETLYELLGRRDALAASLILFVDYDPGQIRVLKNKDAVTAPAGTIIPSDLFDALVTGALDLKSPRVQLPKEKP